jgi:hypothetical protein
LQRDMVQSTVIILFYYISLPHPEKKCKAERKTKHLQVT